ncbi:MarR family transcriptional regulator [Streptomyces hydrogenans]|uniref:MarR family transcriptional regulator n=1 Tax=Streptomyces hydrogenans TaxID=1873719 RepID=UPI003820D19D
MGLRIHFTVEDLARTRVDSSPRPLLELSMALRLLQSRSHPARYGAWRRHVAGQLPREARKVVDLVPVTGWTPDLVSLADTGDPDVLVDRLRSWPRRQVRTELADIAERQALPAWTHRLVDDRRELQLFLDTLLRVHETVLAPWWPQLHARVVADQAVRVRTAAAGLEAVLAGLSPQLRWEAPVLEVLSPCDDDVHLQGRGLLLVPTAMAGPLPVIHPTASPQPLLTYPALIPEHADGLLTLVPKAPGAALSAVAALLGRTRAAVLHVIAERPGCTTKELAGHVGIASASASEHAATLRAAGLVVTSRHRNAVLHTPTALALDLLDAPPQATGLPTPQARPVPRR